MTSRLLKHNHQSCGVLKITHVLWKAETCCFLTNVLNNIECCSGVKFIAASECLHVQQVMGHFLNLRSDEGL